jgi:hypothetical protein
MMCLWWRRACSKHVSCTLRLMASDLRNRIDDVVEQAKLYEETSKCEGMVESMNPKCSGVSESVPRKQKHKEHVAT